MIGVTKRRRSNLTCLKANILFIRQDSGSLKVERTRCAKLKADLLLLDYRQRAGELIELAAVKDEWFMVARAVRDRFLALPSRLSGILAAEHDQHQVFARMTAEIRQILEELSNRPKVGKRTDDDEKPKPTIKTKRLPKLTDASFVGAAILAGCAANNCRRGTGSIST